MKVMIFVLFSIVTISIGRIHSPVDLKGIKPVNIKDDSYLPESERDKGISFSGSSRKIPQVLNASISTNTGTMRSAVPVLQWMKDVPDDTLINKMTIPGTHDSYAYQGKWVGGFARCQKWTVQEQLAHGIRFFDLRFRPVGSSFAIHHGAIYLNKMAGEAFSEFRTFLSNNPSETVIISYQRANTASGPNSKTVPEILKSYVNSYSSWIYKGNEYKNHKTIPKLRDVRGKMFFIDKEDHGDFGLDKDKIWLEDEYDWPGYQTKWNGIVNHLQRSNSNYVFMTFVSANGAKKSLTNWQIARGVTVTWSLYNKIKYWDFLGMTVHVENYLMEKQRSSKTYGIVIFDYPTPKSIGALIKHNPRKSGVKKVCAVLETMARDDGFIAYEGDRESFGGSKWNDNIGYVHLEKRCYLKAYVDTWYSGTMNNLMRPDDNISAPGHDYNIKSTGWIYNWWKNDISSYKCYCK